MHPVSLSVSRLQLLRRYEDGSEAESSIATGFFWKSSRNWFLITNWHNVTGKNPNTNQNLGSFSPNIVRYNVHALVKKEVGLKTAAVLPLEIDLYRGGEPRWIEHPLGQAIDCVAIPLGEMPDGYFATRAINECDFEDKYIPSVGDDCFIVGYPKGLEARHGMPIWKRGSLATEPTVDIDRKPLFLVDSASRKGMSGAPVIVRHSGVFMPNSKLDDQATMGTIEWFAGIYSGRTDDDELGVQIGRVWKRQVISDIIDRALKEP